MMGTVPGMDSCIFEGAQNPADVYKYITGLGAPWDALSPSEQQMAVDKAKTDANGPHEAAQPQAAAEEKEAQLAAQLNAYEKCTTDMAQKDNAYISQQCPNSTTSIVDCWNCSEQVQQSAYFKEHFDCKPPY
jgi:hypothetical protein